MNHEGDCKGGPEMACTCTNRLGRAYPKEKGNVTSVFYSRGIASGFLRSHNISGMKAELAMGME